MCSVDLDISGGFVFGKEGGKEGGRVLGSGVLWNKG